MKKDVADALAKGVQLLQAEHKTKARLALMSEWGVTVLGAGKLGRVYLINGYAVKVQRRLTFVGIVSAAGEVIEAVYRRKVRSPHYPKVYAFASLPSGRWVAVMEKLEPFENDFLAMELADAVDMDDEHYLGEEYVSVIRAAKRLRRHGFKVSDIHDSNLMWRGKTVVLNDVVL